MNLFLVRTAWVLAIGYLLGPIVLNSNVDSLSSLICSLGYSVGKFFYGSAVGGLILLNIFAPDSIVQRVLSHGFFVHLNKLCYSMYLFHPLVVILLFGLRSQPIYLSESIMVSKDGPWVDYFDNEDLIVFFLSVDLLYVRGRYLVSCCTRNECSCWDALCQVGEFNLMLYNLLSY